MGTKDASGAPRRPTNRPEGHFLALGLHPFARTGGSVAPQAALNPAAEDTFMLYWALIFLLIALVAALLGFGGLASGLTTVAQVLFVVFIVLFIVSLATGLVRRPPMA